MLGLLALPILQGADGVGCVFNAVPQSTITTAVEGAGKPESSRSGLERAARTRMMQASSNCMKQNHWTNSQVAAAVRYANVHSRKLLAAKVVQSAGVSLSILDNGARQLSEPDRKAIIANTINGVRVDPRVSNLLAQKMIDALRADVAQFAIYKKNTSNTELNYNMAAYFALVVLEDDIGRAFDAR